MQRGALHRRIRPHPICTDVSTGWSSHRSAAHWGVRSTVIGAHTRRACAGGRRVHPKRRPLKRILRFTQHARAGVRREASRTAPGAGALPNSARRCLQEAAGDGRTPRRLAFVRGPDPCASFWTAPVLWRFRQKHTKARSMAHIKCPKCKAEFPEGEYYNGICPECRHDSRLKYTPETPQPISPPGSQIVFRGAITSRASRMRPRFRRSTWVIERGSSSSWWETKMRLAPKPVTCTKFVRI